MSTRGLEYDLGTYELLQNLTAGPDGALWLTTSSHVMRAVLETVARPRAQVVSGGGLEDRLFSATAATRLPACK